MTTLDEIRKTVPQYSDLSDEALADAVYNKFYSDMPRDQFNLRIGLKPSLSIKEHVTDVAKSAGSGLVDAASGVAGMPGDIQQLGASLFGGGQQPQTPGIIPPPKIPQLPTSEAVRGGIEKLTGPQHQPKTLEGGVTKSVLGHLPQTFVPLGRGLGLPGRMVTQGVIPGVTSELFGQAAKGGPNEGEARAAGSVIGGFTPSAALRAFSPGNVTPSRARAVSILRREGIEPTAGQVTGNKSLLYNESTLGDAPFAGGGGTAMHEQTAEQFTRAMLRRAGVDAPRASQDVVDQAFTNSGGAIGAIAQRTARVPLDATFQRDLGGVVREYNRLVNTSQRAPVVDEFFNDFTQLMRQGGAITGDRYQAFRSRLGELERRTKDNDLREALSGMRNALDDAFQRAVPQADADAMREARRQYRNLLLVENAVTAGGADAAAGLLSPAQMRIALKQQSKRDYSRGRGELSRIVNAANEVLLPLPNSGTAQRNLALGLIPGAVGVGGTAGYASGDPVTGVASGILSMLGPGMMGRGLTHPRVQQYIKNNLAPGQAGAANLRGLLSPGRNSRLQALFQGPRGLLMEDEEDQPRDSR
jgi:hypothetical protein